MNPLRRLSLLRAAYVCALADGSRIAPAMLNRLIPHWARERALNASCWARHEGRDV